MLRGKFLVLNAHIRKEERSEINNLNLYPWKPEKEEKNKHKASRKMKLQRLEISEIENRKTIEKINEIKRCFIKNSKIDNFLARLTKLHIRNKICDIVSDSAGIKWITRHYY